MNFNETAIDFVEEWVECSVDESPMAQMMVKGMTINLRKAYQNGVNDAITVIKTRGSIIGGAIQPDRTIKDIRKLIPPTP